MAVPILSEQVEPTILLIRGQRVMLDTDLATLYGVPAKTLNQAVRRNVSHFPADFMFQLTEKEATALRSQFVTLKTGRGNAENTAPTEKQGGHSTYLGTRGWGSERMSPEERARLSPTPAAAHYPAWLTANYPLG